MCGIIGITGLEEAPAKALAALERLEYRGYDSAGIAALAEGRLSCVKAEGKLSNLKKALAEQPLAGSCAIGHTRWATHGPPTRHNAHPHLDKDRRFAILHNGIIENHRPLKQSLEAKGYEFQSDTDSEVLVHLLADLYEGDLMKAFNQVIEKITGSFAILALSRDHPEDIICAKKGSPLIVGYGQGANFFGSDIPAVLEWTREVTFLEDGDCCLITPQKVSIWDSQGKVVDRTRSQVDWDLSQAEKEGYPHYMLKEIHEQPRAVEQTFSSLMEGDRIHFEFCPDEVLQGIKRVVFVGCGTAWHAGVVGAQLIESMAALPARALLGSEMRYAPGVLDEDCLVVAVTQSGETIDTLFALRQAKECGARTVAICNVKDSAIPRASDGVIYTQAGPEIGVASTKAYTTMLAVMPVLAMKLAELHGRLDQSRRAKMWSEIKGVPAAIQNVLDQEQNIREAARRLGAVNDYFFIGRGLNYPTAYEGALKLKEISYLHAEGYPAGEMKHGPLALVDRDLTAVALIPEGSLRAKVLSNVEEIVARGGQVIGVGVPDEQEPGQLIKHWITIPSVQESLSPIVMVVPLQLLSYYIAVDRGCDVDQPRNLAKSVTVE